MTSLHQRNQCLYRLVYSGYHAGAVPCTPNRFLAIVRTVDGSGIEKARTMSNVIDMYDRFISGHVPELDEKDYLYPMESVLLENS